MTEPPRCPTCNTELPPDTAARLCPGCLLQAGLESQPAASGEPAATAASPTVGFVPPTVESLAPSFPQLEILELLGQGGMGAVYKARQPGLDRLVAVKILPPEVGHDPAFAERFMREARALARLSHPNIVAVYDFGQQTGLYYFVMEYVDGVNLRQAMNQQSVAANQALTIVGQVCDALQFAHDEGIVHRDIKPENILLDKKGRVKIADFGLSKLLGQGQPEIGLTGTHQVMGTLRYMAPEQMEGFKQVDHRADIYSLGVVFYELLTGEVPLGRFEPPSHIVEVDVRLDEVVLRSLAREPAKRYQQASQVRSDVETIRCQPAAQSTFDNSQKAPRQSPQNPTIELARQRVRAPAETLVTFAIIALVTAIGIAAWRWQSDKLYSSQPFNSRMEQVRFSLLAAACTHVLYSVVLGAAGLAMRKLRARFLIVVGCVIVGLFLPAVLALNVVMEHKNMPGWQAIIPLWLGMPAAVWAIATLYREDVQEAFAANLHSGLDAEHRQSNNRPQWLLKRLPITIAAVACGIVACAWPIQYVERGFWGVERASVSGVDGVTISSIAADSPAAAAGFKEGDQLMSINGRKVGFYDISHVWKTLPVGSQVEFRVERKLPDPEKKWPPPKETLNLNVKRTSDPIGGRMYMEWQLIYGIAFFVVGAVVIATQPLGSALLWRGTLVALGFAALLICLFLVQWSLWTLVWQLKSLSDSADLYQYSWQKWATGLATLAMVGVGLAEIRAALQRRVSYIIHQSPESTTYTPSSRFVTAWAATQSQMLRVRTINQVISENQATAASISPPTCIISGTAVPTKTAVRLTEPKGTRHQSACMTNRITNPRKKNSSITGTTQHNPMKRTTKKPAANSGVAASSAKGLNALRTPSPIVPSRPKACTRRASKESLHRPIHTAAPRQPTPIASGESRQGNSR